MPILLSALLLTATFGRPWAELSDQAHPQNMSVSCVPVSERAGTEFGCFIIATNPVGQLASFAFWHLDTYPTRTAAEKAKTAAGVVVEALGKVWLLTIGPSGWRAAGGTRVAEIGPLPTVAGRSYTAQFMEAVFEPA